MEMVKDLNQVRLVPLASSEDRQEGCEPSIFIFVVPKVEIVSPTSIEEDSCFFSLPFVPTAASLSLQSFKQQPGVEKSTQPLRGQKQHVQQ